MPGLIERWRRVSLDCFQRAIPWEGFPPVYFLKIKTLMTQIEYDTQVNSLLKIIETEGVEHEVREKALDRLACIESHFRFFGEF